MIIKTDDTPEKIIKACENLKETKPHLENVLDFYGKIFLLHAESYEILNIKPVLISKELLQTKLEENFPLVTREEFSIDFKAARELFGKICKLCSDYKTEACESMILLHKMMENDELSFKEVATKFLYRDDSWFTAFSEKISSEQNQNSIISSEPDKVKTGMYVTDAKEKEINEKSNMEFILYNSLKPSIVKCSEQISSYLDTTSGKTQLQGYCPICGSTPGLSLLSSENGARSLVCSFCWHEWEIQRIFCPFCGTTDTKKLSYLKIEGEDCLRGDVCDNCSKYIKTIDMREYNNDIYLPLELIAAIPLDMKLKEDGYRSGTE